MDTPNARKILIVDDEPHLRATLAARLTSHGYLVSEAPDAVSGVKLANTERPDLIILDILMPGDDGIQIFQTLRQNPNTQGIPVIFLTSLGKDHMPQRHLADNGQNLYTVIGKPYVPEELVQTIQQVLQET